jgi:outer membrane protein OmpA-like peptidoglycan-associated protein
MPVKLIKFFLLIKAFALLLAVSGIVTNVYAAERRYMAQMEESHWKMTSTSGVYCEMEHAIPRFGKAVFSQEAGRKLQLKLVTHERFVSGLGVEFRSESPIWKPVESRVQLSSLETTGKGSLLKIPTFAARHAYLQLQDGYHPGFFFFENENRFDSMIVSLSTVYFRSVEPEFEQCLTGLYHKNFEDIKLASIHFDNDDEFPRIEEEDTALKPMLDYLQVDKAFSKIVVSGHADLNGTECYNDTLSARRAWYVYDMLVSSGIDPKLIRVDFFGEARPLKKGTTEPELAENRRVSVLLQR